MLTTRSRFLRAACASVIALAVLLAALLLPPAATPLRAGLETFERDTVVIETAAGQRHRFTVELALDGAQQAQGLMFRRDLAPDAGMLFLYGRPREVSMWMKNTLIPLDMLFIADDGRIVEIAERTVPGSLQTIPSGRPVAAVLELNGGTAARLGITPGDRVRHAAFGTAP
jgi:uncharacterized membrane protein (UPF0127 family)